MDFSAKFVYHFSGKFSTGEILNFSEEKNDCSENKIVSNPVDNHPKINGNKAWRTFQIRARSISPGVTFYETVRKE